MNNVQIFQNNQFGQIRVATNENGEPMFAGIDVAKILGYVIPDKAIRDHVDEDDRILMKLADIQDPSKLAPNMKGSNIMMITEPGVYSLIFGSNLPSAKDFQRWVASEVLPSIRKHGAYLSQQRVEEILSNPDTIIELATKMKEERAKRLEAEQRAGMLEHQNELHKEQLQIQAPKVQYYNEVMDSSGLITINKIALDLGMSAIRLNRILCEKKIQYREGSSYLLFTRYRDKGYAVLRPHPYIDSLGRQQTSQHLYWTEKGREFIREVMNWGN